MQPIKANTAPGLRFPPPGLSRPSCETTRCSAWSRTLQVLSTIRSASCTVSVVSNPASDMACVASSESSLFI